MDQHAVTLPIEVACEVVYVLQKVYQIERQQIAQSFYEILNKDLIIIPNKTVFLKALEF